MMGELSIAEELSEHRQRALSPDHPVWVRYAKAMIPFAASATLATECPVMQSGPLVCRGHSMSQFWVANQQALHSDGSKLTFCG